MTPSPQRKKKLSGASRLRIGSYFLDEVLASAKTCLLRGGKVRIKRLSDGMWVVDVFRRFSITPIPKRKK